MDGGASGKHKSWSSLRGSALFSFVRAAEWQRVVLEARESETPAASLLFVFSCVIQGGCQPILEELDAAGVRGEAG